MLVLNMGKAKQDESDWVYLDTSDGIVAFKLKRHNTDIRCVIHAPKNVKVQKGNNDAKTASNFINSDSNN